MSGEAWFLLVDGLTMVGFIGGAALGSIRGWW